MALEKGDKYLATADKTANKFDWFTLNRRSNQEDAAELYAKAAAQYKIGKEYAKAGLAYSRAAECNMAVSNDIEAKASWREAGKCYRHVDFEKAIESYKNAIQLNLDGDRFGQAARLQEEIGDMLAEDDHLTEAMEAYEQSADYYEAENDTSNKNKRLLKVAHMAARAKQWDKAIRIFDATAKASVDNNLLRWKVKEYAFKAMLLTICKLAQDDIVGTKSVSWKDQGAGANERYCDLSDIYATSRECQLITKILEALPTDEQAFKDAVADYDRICKLDKWNFELVYLIEKYITDKQTEAPDDLDQLGGMGPDDNGPSASNNYNEPNDAPKANPFAVNEADLEDAPDL